jgi:CheY-like chemotaxis protein
MKAEADANPALAKTQAVLQRQTTHMAKLLDGLLDLSRIIRGKIRLHLERIDFVDVCRQVVDDASNRDRNRNVELRGAMPHEPLYVKADRVRLVQIVDNLLSNAVKFTPDGGSVTLSLQQEPDMAVLIVRDTGVGIERDLLPHVFETFRQSEQSLDRSAGGLGIGLALVKTLAQHHKGTVTARSEGKGLGSEFVVRIPRADDVASSGPRLPDEVSVAPVQDLRILVIEDNEDAAEMLKQVLELFGHRVTTAGTAHEGIERARESHPDLILCDIGLPGGVSGYEVARALRADPATRTLRIVALSGYGRPEDKARVAEVGFDGHLTKPVDMDALKAVLSGVVSAPALA